MAAELRQVQLGRRGDALVGGDPALQAAAGVGRVLRRADRDGVAEGGAPGRVGEGLLRLQAKAVARDDPADALDHAGSDEPGGGDDRQQALAAARGHRGEDVAQLGLTRVAIASTTPARSC